MVDLGAILEKGSIYRAWALLTFTLLLLSLLLPLALLPAARAEVGKINQLLGTFTDSGQALGQNAGNAVAAGDLDGDDDVDVVMNGQVWLNDGAGIFTQKSQEPGLVDSFKFEIALADVDADEDLDLLIAAAGPNGVWLNDGSATFSNSGQMLGANNSWAVAVGDVDDDQDIDALFATEGGHELYLNNGNGAFTPSGQMFGQGGVRAVALRDVDGDTDLDAFFADCSLYLNDGSGVFSFKEGSACNPTDAVTLDMGDIDGDNDIDAVIGNATTHANIVMLNDGDGVFSDSGQALGSSSTEQVTLGDVDLDGDLDLYTGNTVEMGGDPADKVWLNDGGGVFSDSGQALGETNSIAIALADVDGDGDPDALVGSNEAENKLYLNGMAVVYMPVVMTD